MQNGTRKMLDTRYTSIYKGKQITTFREQLPAETCKTPPSDRKANVGKAVNDTKKL